MQARTCENRRISARWSPRWIVTVTGLIVAGVLLVQPQAWAHAELTGSDPIGGATLQQAPAQVRLTFSDPVDPRFVTVAVTDQDGGHPPLAAPAVEHNQVVQPLPGLADGGYTIAYRIVSADGHPVAGQVQFTVTASTPQQGVAPDANASSPPSEAASESQSRSGWLLWGGGVAVVLVIVGGVVSLRRLGRES